MDTFFPILENLGLNEKEIKVYIACLELGSGTIQKISTKSGVKRTSIYNFIDELKGRGLVSEMKQDGHTIFVAQDPSILRQRALDKEAEAKDYARKIEQALPALMSIFNLPGHKPKVYYFQGVDGLKQVYEDTISEGVAIYAFSDYERMSQAIGSNYLMDYSYRRATHNIIIHSIATVGPWTERTLSQIKNQRMEIRLLKNAQIDTEINIYANKVAFISFRRPYSAVLIDDRAISQTLKSVWKTVWDGLGTR
ncbi:hypothetical protein KKA13_00280 [Patescibacteria group bacterium]|nr:hypothetical protein [Patescibacteria group bacterium]